ncbi:hypothetical protein CJ305_18195 [Leeuwenhoekiella nanhaiensis]|uniref:Uncharacterized protein n=1 Tax=Leeuwenhoekiella nanhaiensis TaxID=1655491 RepID=A0A2G1VLY8_9FLAO|nr:hypothetical protein CJ305_18195 [Leeuwenhoekiella nanhaiensis]
MFLKVKLLIDYQSSTAFKHFQKSARDCRPLQLIARDCIPLHTIARHCRVMAKNRGFCSVQVRDWFGCGSGMQGWGLLQSQDVFVRDGTLGEGNWGLNGK